MTDNTAITELSVELISLHSTYTDVELCRLCDLHTDELLVYLEYGIIETVSGESRLYNHVQVERLQRAQRLQADLQVNYAGAALALDLLDKIEKLERNLALGRR